MSDLRDKADGILADASATSGVRDAIIATRDGLPAMGELSAGDADTVSAMAAAALAAAETASLDVGAGSIDHLRATCNGSEILIAGLDDQYVLVLVADDASALTAFEKAHNELKTVLAE